MKIRQRRLNVERHETQPGARQCVQAVYIKAMDLSWTMSGSTGEVRWRMFQLVWLASTQTAYVNLQGISHLLPK